MLSESAQLEYKCTHFYSKGDELSVVYNDPEIGIAWPLETEPLLSAKDAAAPRLRDILDLLPAYAAGS